MREVAESASPPSGPREALAVTDHVGRVSGTVAVPFSPLPGGVQGGGPLSYLFMEPPGPVAGSDSQCPPAAFMK